MIIASNIIWPSYISFWSALRYHNLTNQLPQCISVITTRARKKREIIFDHRKIIFTRVKPKYFFGFRKERYQNFDIFIAEPEKALIDSVLFKKISFTEISEMIKENMDEIDVDLLMKYMIRIENKALIKRFGYLLEKLGVECKILRKFIDLKYVVLDYKLPSEGRKNKRWRIIENVRV